jgi:hypothetical protein
VICAGAEAFVSCKIKEKVQGTRCKAEGLISRSERRGAATQRKKVNEQALKSSPGCFAGKESSKQKFLFFLPAEFCELYICEYFIIHKYKFT